VYVIVVMMVMTVKSMCKGAAQSPYRIRHTEADQEKTRHRDHALAEGLKHLRTKHECEQSEQHGHSYVTEATDECHAHGSRPRPVARARDRRDRKPMVWGQRV
jgi:hypothetical protein